MKKLTMREAIVEKILGTVFTVLGVLLLAAGLVDVLFVLHFKSHAVKTDALVTEVNMGTEVQYTYEGQEYTAWTSAYSSGIRKGSSVAVYVDVDDPQHVKLAPLLYLSTIVLCSIGVPFAIVGVVFLLIVGRKSRNKKRLMASGRKIFAEVTGGSLNRFYTLNNRHPWKLDCSYTDEGTGNTYLYSSGNVFVDPQAYMGRQVAVYVDPADPSRYYVDVDSLQGIDTGVYDYRK